MTHRRRPDEARDNHRADAAPSANGPETARRYEKNGDAGRGACRPDGTRPSGEKPRRKPGAAPARHGPPGGPPPG
ncbi:MAG: hypothetical protein LBH65_03935, partial [Desulfovibrio sp.]|nr:hypothetical protein [Desulfovibrio sp.]